MSSAVNSDIADLEGWLALLMDCKQLPENDVQKLSEKVNKQRRYNFYEI